MWILLGCAIENKLYNFCSRRKGLCETQNPGTAACRLESHFKEIDEVHRNVNDEAVGTEIKEQWEGQALFLSFSENSWWLSLGVYFLGSGLFLTPLTVMPPRHLLLPNACKYFSDLNTTAGSRFKCACYPFSYFKCSISDLSYFWNSFFDEEVSFFKNCYFLNLAFFLPCCFLHYQHFPVHPFRMVSSGTALQSSWRWIINRDEISMYKYHIYGHALSSCSTCSGCLVAHLRNTW